jgi:nucleotide-binding universal stress UspA family protein
VNPANPGRRREDSAMTVVVAVDGSGASRTAIQLAAYEARCRRAGLVAVTAYRAETQASAPAARPVGTLTTGAEVRASAENALRDAVSDALGPDAADVELLSVAGPAGKAVVEAARQASAELIVLATRPGLSMLPGGVSQYVLRNARLPVLMVPASVDDEGLPV